MNCFVIMPFARDFDDVYTTIKTTVEGATAGSSGRCFRLDERQPAGRITERLLKELKSASICIADLTGCRPNVMWELGYAMAWGYPVILVTQTLADLPFDLKDLQSIEYDRSRLSATLSVPLRRMVIDTISDLPSRPTHDGQQRLIGDLLHQVTELQSMLAQTVATWGKETRHEAEPSRPAGVVNRFEGAWVVEPTGSHVYGRVVKGKLIAPYCYRGDSEVTGVYSGWRRIGGYWRVRYEWLDKPVSGFAFLKEEAVGVLTGMIWSDQDRPSPMAGGQGGGGPRLLGSEMPPDTGVETTWRRKADQVFPLWATEFLDDVEEHGLQGRLRSRLTAPPSP